VVRPPQVPAHHSFGHALLGLRGRCTHADLRAAGQLVTTVIGRELRSEGLPPTTFAGLEPDKVKVILARTADRSVLGCINDMAFLCENAISKSGGLSRTDLAALNRSLRRHINSARSYHSFKERDCLTISLDRNSFRPSKLSPLRPQKLPRSGDDSQLIT